MIKMTIMCSLSGPGFNSKIGCYNTVVSLSTWYSWGTESKSQPEDWLSFL